MTVIGACSGEKVDAGERQPFELNRVRPDAREAAVAGCLSQASALPPENFGSSHCQFRRDSAHPIPGLRERARVTPSAAAAQ
jgi:hypothetical protein